MKDLEQLVQYLDGELNALEKQQLVEKLKNDPSLSEKLDLIKDVDALIGDKHLDSFENNLKEIEALYFKNKNEKENSFSRKRLFKIQIAAVIIIMVAAASYFIVFKTNKIKTTDEIFVTYYQKMDADFGTRSEENNKDSFIAAIKLYNENKYREAITEFNKIVKEDPSNNAARLFLGICYTETQQYDFAKGQFKSIINLHDPIFEEHAAWYLSLCYIKTQNNSLAKPLLDKLVSSRSFYMGKASEILQQMH